MKQIKRILVCPLNWGLGHATRCIPVINELLSHEAEVIIGAEGRALELLKREFPQLTIIPFAGYNIQYAKKRSLFFQMLLSVPKIVVGIIREHFKLKAIVRKYQIDAVISDNRYGLWHKSIPSVFITHQLFIKSPFAQNMLNTINHYFIHRFTQCWVPDFPDEQNLSGELSHKPFFPTPFFIGPLSRFYSNEELNQSNSYDVMIILSGPEPQRTVLEEIILKQLEQVDWKVIVVRGITEKTEKKQYSNIEMYNHFTSAQMFSAMLASQLIISRAGYSTLMDVAALGKKAIFIPTPGQTEQEYLAAYHKEKGHFYTVHQNEFNLIRAVEEAKKYSGIKINEDNALLQHTLKAFIGKTESLVHSEISLLFSLFSVWLF